LIADQGAGAQAKPTADGGAGGGMSDRRTDEAADRGATQRPDAGAFFPGGQRAAGAAAEQQVAVSKSTVLIETKRVFLIKSSFLMSECLVSFD